LLHDQFDVFALQSRLINLFTIILILVLLLIVACLNGLALAVSAGAMVMTSVLVNFAGLNDLVGGVGLRLGVEILNFGLSEDALVSLVMYLVRIVRTSNLHPCVARGRLVDIGAVDDEQDLYWLADVRR
jgi:hypothetical protein